MLNKSYWTDHSEIRQYLRTMDKHQTAPGQHFPQPPTTQSTDGQMLQDTQILNRKDEKKPHENGYKSDSVDRVALPLNTMAILLDVDSTDAT